MLGHRLQPDASARSAPGRPYATIQAALDAALREQRPTTWSSSTRARRRPTDNPRGAYYENLVMASPVKLQGVGPGGFQGSTYVPGSIIDASAFGGDTAAGDRLVHQGRRPHLGRQPDRQRRRGDLRARLAERDHGRRPGAPVHQRLQGRHRRLRHPRRRPARLPGQHQRPHRRPTGLPPNIITQGGAIFANAYARYLQITNNVVQNNGGGYGTIRIGTPDLAGAGHQPAQRERPDRRQPDHRQRRHQPGRRRSGIFAGADGYEVAGNDICGNFSLEYGGGVSVYGRSPNGKIHHNRIYFNISNDEGGGIMIAGAAAGRPRRRSRPAPARWTSTPTRSRPTWPTTTAAASGS